MMASKPAVAAVTAAALALSGCAGLPRYLAWLHPHRAPPLAVQPVETPAPEIDATERLYRAAVVAIDAREYGRSLDLLQMARERSPGDVRVLNALGVTYDKLGRFDLSARFYAEALAAAPDSPVVMANMAYSQVLQRQFTPAPAQLAVAPASPTPLTLEASAPQLSSTMPMLTVATPRLVGRPLVVVNAGGDGETVRRRLAVLGWSVTRSLRQVPRLTESRILYPAEHRAVALALANTLPFNTQMAACADDCRGLSLILGENAQWRG